jgi:hypothetical protein
MSISSVFSSGAGSSSCVDQDLQIKTLKAKIQDWSTCPTTDPQTKRAIVSRLQVQLDALTSSIQGHAQAKDSQPTGPTPVATPGLGATIDIRA